MKKNKTITVASSLLGIATFIMGIPGILPDEISRTPFLIATIILLSISFILFIISFFELRYMFHNLRALKKLGIAKIHYTGTSGKNTKSEAITNAKIIKFMAVSGEGFIKTYKNEIIDSLINEKSTIKILLATKDSDFVKDVELTESINRVGHISPEISKSKAMLQEYIEDAKSKIEENMVVGRIFVGHFNTHLRNSILICDDSFGWITLNIPPSRAIQSPSFELKKADKGLLTMVNIHFDRIWDICSSENRITEIQ